MRSYIVITIILFSKADYRMGETNNSANESTTPKVELGFYRDIVQLPYTVSRKSSDDEMTVDLKEFPTIAALLDKRRQMKCSASIITSFWVLTAGHCVSFDIAYIKYNTRKPMGSSGDLSPVKYIFRHPNYEVEQIGKKVTHLQHDIGALRSRDPMVIKSGGIPSILDFVKYNMDNLMNEEVKMVGFIPVNQYNKSEADHQLFSVKLQLRKCAHKSCIHCICGSSTQERSERGVCAGSSGSPVIYNRTQVGVTSMAPLDCSNTSRLGHSAINLFTSIHQYTGLLNSMAKGDNVTYEDIKNIDFNKGICPTRNLNIVMLVIIALLFSPDIH